MTARRIVSACLGALAVWFACGRAAVADVRIAEVVVDGSAIDLPRAERQGDKPVVRVPSTAREIEIRVAGEWDNDVEAAGAGGPAAARPPRGTRLRYRLDGVDAGWRDAPAEARVFLQFVDERGRVIDSAETSVSGESAGWTGLPETSAFERRELTATAPPLAKRVAVNFLSHGGDEVVGAIGIDDVVFSVLPAGATQPVLHPRPTVPSTVPPHPLDSPDGWTRRGSRGELAQMRMRPNPEPHPIMVLVDDDPTRFGNWGLVEAVAVEPGDRVTLSWQESHSLGIGGEIPIRYEALKPGTYWFRAGAFRPAGEPTGHEASLAIEIFVPWYRRPETLIAGIGLAGVGAFAVARSLALRRIKQRLEAVEREHALERERARIARDLHDEVGAGLTEIAMQHFWVQRELAGKAPPAALDRVEKARQSAVDLVRSVDAIVWAVNPANDTLDRFVPYLTHSVEQFLEAAGVRPRIDVPEQLPHVVIDGAMRHSLFLVVREAVNNAVKHARPDSVGIRVRVEAGRLSIEVDDDGAGVPPERTAGVPTAGVERSGLGNMRCRIEDLGGRFSVEAKPGGGTRVSIEVPFSATAVS